MTLPRSVRAARDAAAGLEFSALAIDVAAGDLRDAGKRFHEAAAYFDRAVREAGERSSPHGLDIDAAAIGLAAVKSALAGDPLPIAQAQASSPLRGLAVQIRTNAKAR